MVHFSGTIPSERRGGNWSGLCYIEDVTNERETCWEPTVRHHVERTDSMGLFIWRCGVGNRIYHLLQGWGNFYGNCVLHKGTMVWKIYVRLKTIYGSN